MELKHAVITLACLPILLVVLSFEARAEPFSNTVGLAGNVTLDTDFSEAIAELGTDTTPGSFFPLLSFSEFQLGPSFFGGSGIRTSISPNTFVKSAIYFSEPVDSVALLIREDVPTRFTILLEDNEVGTFVTAGLGFTVPRYYGFTNVFFDAIEFSHDEPPFEPNERFLGIDRLQIYQSKKSVALPYPLTGLLILSGLLCGFVCLGGCTTYVDGNQAT